MGSQMTHGRREEGDDRAQDLQHVDRCVRWIGAGLLALAVEHRLRARLCQLRLRPLRDALSIRMLHKRQRGMADHIAHDLGRLLAYLGPEIGAELQDGGEDLADALRVQL